MIVLFWILNFLISWLNAWGCGKTWNEAKYAGGFPRLIIWSAAIMAACGFTWCYMVIAVALGGTIQVEQDDGSMAAYLTAEQVQAVADLGYMLIIFPILGSGIVITIHAWGVAYRRRTLGSGAVAAWDTFAMVYNVSSALRNVPDATSRLGEFFFSSKGDSKGKGQLIVVMLVVLCAVAGIVTTYLIITKTAKSTARSRAFKYQAEAEVTDNTYDPYSPVQESQGKNYSQTPIGFHRR